VVTVTSGGDLSVSADDHTSVISIAGALAGGSVGVGIGADVGVYHKHTTAYIDSGVTADVNGDIKVGATSGESLISVAAGISAGSVAVAVNAGVHVFDLHTRAFIGDDPTDLIASAGAGDVHAHGSVVVSADDLTDVNESAGVVAAGSVGVAGGRRVRVTHKKGDGTSSPITGAFARTASLDSQSGFHGVAVAATNRDEIRTFTVSFGAGAVGIGVSAGVDVVNADTEAYIGANATVNGSTAGAS